LSEIIGLNGKVLKSKFRQKLEANTWKPMMGAVMCLDCSRRWMLLMPVRTNLFRISCPGCQQQNSWVTIIPREYESNFTQSDAPKDLEPPPQGPAAA